MIVIRVLNFQSLAIKIKNIMNFCFKITYKCCDFDNYCQFLNFISFALL